MHELINIKQKFSDGVMAEWMRRTIIFKAEENLVRIIEEFDSFYKTEQSDIDVKHITNFSFDVMLDRVIREHIHYSQKVICEKNMTSRKYVTFNSEDITIYYGTSEHFDAFGNSPSEHYINEIGAITVIRLNLDLFKMPELLEKTKCLDTNIKIYEKNKTKRAIRFRYGEREIVIKELEVDTGDK